MLVVEVSRGWRIEVEPYLRQMTLAVHAKFSWEGGIKGGAKFLRMEQGAVAVYVVFVLFSS